MLLPFLFLEYYQKKTYLTINIIFGLIWRVTLDCHIFGDLEKIVTYIVEDIKNDKIDLTKNQDNEIDLINGFQKIANYVWI